jgi:hypothetical protein
MLVCGWESVEVRGAFTETEEVKEFGRIREFLSDSEVKHEIRWRRRV